MSAATKKAPRERLTLRDAMDLLLLVNRYVEDHVDELELNGGALPDDLAAILDEIDVALTDRADALANKIDEFEGYAFTAKATKDRAARREKVWNNVIKSMKSYGLLQVQRNGGTPIKGATSTLRMQRNGQPSTEHTYTNEQLVAIHDEEVLRQLDLKDIPVEPRKPEHPLARFVSVQRVATLDTRAIATAYEARRAELEASITSYDPADAPDIFAQLAAEFPGVTVTRGYHLRID